MKHCSAAEKPWPANLFPWHNKTCLFGTYSHKYCMSFLVEMLTVFIKLSFHYRNHSTCQNNHSKKIFAHIMQPFQSPSKAQSCDNTIFGVLFVHAGAGNPWKHLNFNVMFSRFEKDFGALSCREIIALVHFLDKEIK